MACCPTEEKYGYDDSRFENEVDETFHCSICYNVLKEPRMCRNNEHIFCIVCITKHLKMNTQTCPECNENLSVDTLRRPRVVDKYLSKLKINCDYAIRGCDVFTCLGQLQIHVENCGYAPVLCSNAECGMEINKQDKVHHETKVCEYRNLKCHDCVQIHDTAGRLERRLIGLDAKVEKAINGANRKYDKCVKDVKEINQKVNGVIEKMKAEFKKEIGEVKREVQGIKENFYQMNEDITGVRAMMTKVFEKLNTLEFFSKPPMISPTELSEASKVVILIAGGGNDSEDHPISTTEIFSWEKNCWLEVFSMNEVHNGASSFVYKDQVFVVGGEETKVIESCDLNERPLKWTKRGKLPYECDDHQTVVCQDRIFHIGGYNYDKDEYLDVITELQIKSPCTMKEMCRMPEPRECHSAEVVEDKVLILGGALFGVKSTDSVLEFDPKRNTCKEMPKLPYPLKEMATVRWRDEIIVLGGRDEDTNSRNDVFAYNCKTGPVRVLPSMLVKRYSCCAVITGDTIVVLGGLNDDDEPLTSAESFKMGSSEWEYFPNMNIERFGAIAQILPGRETMCDLN